MVQPVGKQHAVLEFCDNGKDNLLGLYKVLCKYTHTHTIFTCILNEDAE